MYPLCMPKYRLTNVEESLVYLLLKIKNFVNLRVCSGDYRYLFNIQIRKCPSNELVCFIMS